MKNLPWAVDPSPRCGGYAVIGANGRDVAVATQRDPHPTLGQCITDAEALEHAHLIAIAPELKAENAALRADLNDARSNWESGAEELRQADLVREQLVAALKIGRDVIALVGFQDHLIDYDAVSKGRKVVADALKAAGAP
jgi:hypothetical protein